MQQVRRGAAGGGGMQQVRRGAADEGRVQLVDCIVWACSAVLFLAYGMIQGCRGSRSHD